MQENHQIGAENQEISSQINDLKEIPIVGSGVALPSAEARFPVRLGDYQLLSLIGSGALGNVYRARGGQCPDREVAIKVLRRRVRQQGASGDGTQTYSPEEAFEIEANAAGLMRHPHILRVLDSGECAGYAYIVTDLVLPARTLRDLIAAGPVHDCAYLARLIYMCACGLAHVHRHGIVHRDVKPENILCDASDNVKISDFGIAYLRRESRQVSESHILGSPHYMSPEQLRKEELTHKSDLFSLGVIFYELLTGRHPFAGAELKAVIRSILGEQPPAPLAEVRPGLPQGLQGVIDHCLAKKPGQRYNSCRALADALHALFPEIADKEPDPMVEELNHSMRELKFFEDFSDDEIRNLAESVIYEEYPVGEDIICEGRINRAFYILTRGSVEVTKRQSSLDMLRPGDCFGEMGYLTDIKRTATVTAREPGTTVISINSALVEQLPDNVQLKFTKAFIRVLVARLQQTTRTLTVYLDE